RRTREAVPVGCGFPPLRTSPIKWYSCQRSAASLLAQHERMTRPASWAWSSPSISEEISWVMSQCSCIRPRLLRGPSYGVCGPVNRCSNARSLLPTLVLARPELRAELLRHRLARPEDPRPDGAD